MTATGTKIAFALAASAAFAASAASAQLVTQGGIKFSATLSGANECNTSVTPTVCGVGDPNATGWADITLNRGQQRVCWEITTANVNPEYTLVGAHIHLGVAGTNGGVVVPLSATINGTAAGCRSVSRSLIDQIIAAPQNYYVNLHWRDEDPSDGTLTDYSAGAIRGQLSKGRVK